MTRRIFVLIILMSCVSRSACGWGVDFSARDESTGDTRIALRAGMWSRHYGDNQKEGHNETHKQLGLKYGEYTAWSFINSSKKRGYYVGKDDLWKWDWLSGKLPVNIKYGFTTGVLTGYKFKKDRHWSPIILPIAAVDITKNFSLDFQFVPNIVTSVNLRWSF